MLSLKKQPKLSDTIVFPENMISNSENNLQQEKTPSKYEDFKQNPKFDEKVMVFSMNDGILKVHRPGSFDFKSEEKKNNWLYRTYTSDGMYCLIDYDKDKARPYFKALLSKVNKLLEVKLLWFIIAFMVLSSLFSIVFWIIVLSQIWNVQDGIKNIKIPTQNNVQVVPNGWVNIFEDVKDQTKNQVIETKKNVPQNRIFPAK